MARRSFRSPCRSSAVAVRGALPSLDTRWRHRRGHRLPERWAILRFFLVVGGGDVHSLDVSRRNYRGTRAQTRRSRRACAARHQIAPANPRLHHAFRRDRIIISHAFCAILTQALYNRIDAIESFAADVAQQTEESTDLSAQRRRIDFCLRVKAGPSSRRSAAQVNSARCSKKRLRPAHQRYL